jgi:uncharacterized protein
MPDLRFPRIVISEMPARSPAITGAPTAVTVLLGPTRVGPLRKPVRIHSPAEFASQFGNSEGAQEIGPSVRLFFANGGREAWIVRVASTARPSNYASALRAAEKIAAFNLMALPGVSDGEALRAALDLCVRRHAILLVDAARPDLTASALLQTLSSPAFPLDIATAAARNAAFYFPWLVISDASAPGRKRCVPASAAVAGVIARSDHTRGVWKSPAGIDAELRDASDVALPLNDTEMSLLNSAGVNCLRIHPAARRPTVWGARTLRGADRVADEFKYLAHRRLALFILTSVQDGITWAVFEPAGDALFTLLRRSIEDFLFTLFRQGALQGTKPEQAFFVKCGRDTTTAADLAQGVVHILIGFAALKPAEFVTLSIAQRTATP